MVEGRSHPGYVANLAHGRSITLSKARMQRAPKRRTRAYIPPTHPRRRSRVICMCPMRWCIRERARTHQACVCAASSKRCVFFPFLFPPFLCRVRLTIELPYDLFFSCPSLVLLFQTRRAPTQRRPCMDLPLFDRPGLWNASTMATSAPTSLKTPQTEGR